MAFGSPQWMYSSGEYEIDQSLKFNDDDSAYLSWTPASAGNRKTFTVSLWAKRSSLGASSNYAFLSTGGYNIFGFADEGIRFEAGATFNIKTTALYRDTSAWYHIVLSVDTTQSTASNRIKIYVNGEQQTDLAFNTYPSQNVDCLINSVTQHDIGKYSTSRYLDGYLAELNFIDGQALTPADFGKTGDYGEWKPKKYSGTYGTNGFYLPFKQDYTVEGFSTVTYKGNGTYGHYIGGTGFKPDLTWIRERATISNHYLLDSIRGANNVLYSDLTNAEQDISGPGSTVIGFKNDGFALGTSGGVNQSGNTNVAWNWDMGADTPTGFGCVTWTGDASSSRDINGVGFSPDLVWGKSRSDAVGHHLFDTVRGATKQVESNGTNAESTQATMLTKFNPDGFTIGNDNAINGSARTQVAWCWDMGDTTVTNTSGSISSQVRANPTYGQSIVSYTGNGSDGATVGHGLSSAPDMVIVKSRDSVHSWSVGHVGLGTNEVLLLNQTSAKANCTTDFSSGGVGARGATTFTLEAGTLNANNVNTNNEGFIAYCFHSVSGYSKIGSYSGTGSTGNSITTGFKPAFILVKRADSTGSWVIWDSTRDSFNPNQYPLYPNLTNAETLETTARNVQHDSNGFTLLDGNNDSNASGGTYIYMAFAGGMDSISDYNTDGSIDSRVKANPTYGQSIVSYVGTGSATTVGHGLSSAPDLIIVKNRDYAQDWAVYDSVNGSGYFLRLNADNARQATTTAWNNDATSSVFGVGNWTATNKSGDNHIAYCWHSVTGYSKIGSYTGSGSGGSPTITLGFRPAFFVVKNASAVDNWRLYDNTRTTNLGETILYPNLNVAEDSSSVSANWHYTVTDTTITPKGGNNNASGNTFIYMAFADKREYAYWLDQSGNNNDWTSNNLTESDISVDSPSNNFATMNPLDKDSDITLYEGNTRAYSTNSGGYACTSTISTDSGKWYAEINSLVLPASTRVFGGWALNNYDDSYTALNDFIIHNLGSYQRYVALGSNYDNVSTSFAAGDILQLAWDMDAGKFWFGKNGTWINSGNPTSGTNAIVTSSSVDSVRVVYRVSAGAGTTGNLVFNFGQDSSFAGNKTSQGYQDSNDIGDFYYEPPTGFLALCTKNLPDVDVTPSEHFNTVLYTGTGITNRAITGVGFQPDLVWAKARNNAQNHTLFNSISGVTKYLNSNTTTAESTNSETLLSFDSDGYTLGNAFTNESAYTYAAWNWKANGSGSSNTNGTITSTVSANVDAGFSIVSWTGNEGSDDTIGHGLSKAPEMIIAKVRGEAWSWAVFHEDVGKNKKLLLNSTDAEAIDTDVWADTLPTSSVFTVGTDILTNWDARNYIGYCFHSVDGYSKVGSYIGNGNADGPFVYTGFRPAFVMVKSSSMSNSETNWVIWDNERNGYNDNVQVFANQSWAEGQRDDNAGAGIAELDILSNGFKHRDATWAQNGQSGATFIYIAFAETPFKYSNAR